MNLLLDSGVWFRYSHRLPLSAEAEALIESPDNRLHLSPLSVLEIVYKWRSGRLDCEPPELWLDAACAGYAWLNVTDAIAREAALWPWEHGDPVDRVLAATAKVHDVVLIHTDSRLKDLEGFPQRYFRGTN